MGTCTAPRHNTYRAYTDAGCRCPDTIALMRAGWRRWRRRSYIRASHTTGWSNSRDLDEVVVLRVCDGRSVGCTTAAERREVVATLTARGLSVRRIAEVLGCSARTVERWRARLATTA